MPSAFRIEALGRQHDRSAFTCGSVPLDQYLRERARQDAEKFVAAPFVLLREGSQAILGYYTLSASSISAAEIAPELAKKLPRYKLLPVTLVGRLAIDQSVKGQGRGAFLFMDALRRCALHAEQVAAMAVVVDAKDAAAVAFYAHFGFVALDATPTRLYIPMKTVVALTQGAAPTPRSRRG